MSQYNYLANKWYDIKEKEFDYPDFRDPSKTCSYETVFAGDMLTRYDSFAWICWAHAEDIYSNGFHKEAAFKPTIKWYKELHYNWLMNPDNYKRFRTMPGFIEYVNELEV